MGRRFARIPERVADAHSGVGRAPGAIRPGRIVNYRLLDRLDDLIAGCTAPSTLDADLRDYVERQVIASAAELS
jgi:hypothetical protein